MKDSRLRCDLNDSRHGHTRGWDGIRSPQMVVVWGRGDSGQRQRYYLDKRKPLGVGCRALASLIISNYGIFFAYESVIRSQLLS